MSRIPLNRAYEQSENLKDKLEMSTAEIGLAVRTTNCLEERGVFTVNDLLHCTREDLLSISNFGEKTLEEVYKALERVGFYRPGRKPEPVGTIAKGVRFAVRGATPFQGVPPRNRNLQSRNASALSIVCQETGHPPH
jgi:DNA-directed RNA polymerase subunit alpha